MFRDPADTFPLTVADDAKSAVAVVVASVEVPVTARVPFEIRDDVAVIAPLVIEIS